MKTQRYDFDTLIDRHGSFSVKWDECPDPEVIPMWVADMDFKAAPFIIEAVKARVGHGIFGYTYVPEEYYKSVINWFETRRGWKIRREWIQYISGIVPALSVAVEALSAPGDNVIFHTPAYNCFFAAVRNNGRKLLESPLVYDDSGESPTYHIDFDDFERKCADPRTTLFILCNPQNPAGRVWTREELARLGNICRANGVTVVSDEIHCELEMPGQCFTPFASLSEADQECSVIFNSPSKSFNIAGLEIANIICADPAKAAKIDKVINRFEHCDVNPLGVAALMAAYTPEGAEWLRQLNAYLWENYSLLVRMFAERLPEVRVCRLEGTYLAWVDCRAFTSAGVPTKLIQDSLLANEKVWVNSGTMYGDGDFMRINLACPRSVLEEGVSRMLRGLKRLAAQ